MQNRYEEASKELERLRAMNRYLTSSLRSHESRTFKPRKPSPIKENKSFLSDLDDDFDTRQYANIPATAKLRYAGRNRTSRFSSSILSDEDDRDQNQSSFLSSDMPNAAISRLHLRSNDYNHHRSSHNKNVSFNNSFNASTSHSFNGNETSNSTYFNTSENRQLKRLDLEDNKPNVGTSTYRPTHDDSDDYEADEERRRRGNRSKLDYSEDRKDSRDVTTDEEGHLTSKESDLSPSQMNRSTQTNGSKKSNLSTSRLDFSFSSTHPHRERLTRSYHRSPSPTKITIPGNITPNTSSTSVLSAFRELQNKIKAIENERYLLNQEKDELKQSLLELKRSSSLEKNKIEIETTESLLHLKSIYDKLKKTYHDLQYQYLSQEDIYQSYDKKKYSQEQYISSLQHDIVHYQEKVLSLEKEQILLRKNRQESKYRVEDLEVTKRLSPQKHAREELPYQHELTTLYNNIHNVSYDNEKLQLKIESLQSYIDVIIKVNGDLCDTLIDREKAKGKFLRALSPPPRYTWPKEIPYNNILQVVNDAAKVQATAVLETSAVKATEAAMKSIIRAISPSKSPSRAGSVSPRSRSPNDAHRSYSRHVTDYSEDGVRVHNSPEKIQRRLEHSLNNLTSSAQKRYHYDADVNHSVHFDDDDDRLNMHSDEDEDEEQVVRSDDGLGRYTDPDIFDQKKTRRVKKRGVRGGRKRSSSAGVGGRSCSSSLTRRQANSVERLITRQGAITSATRFAAAATAAINAANVVNTPSVVHSNHSRHTSPSLSEGGRGRGTSKVDFIPSGAHSKEFNVIASVSKASRAAKTLNAHLASR